MLAGERLEALFVLALMTGLRRGELLGMRWNDVELESRQLHVRRALQRSGGSLRFVEPKTESSVRTGVLPRLAVRSLREHRRRQNAERFTVGAAWRDHGLVFASSVGYAGHVHQVGDVERLWAMDLDDARHIEVNGERASADAVALLDHEGWGHFTAMQVRNGRTRGLGFHLDRLETAHREIYGKPLDGELIRARIRQALDGRADASVRVYGYWAGLIVTVRGPQEMLNRPYSMTAQHFQRPLARLKHVGSWGQGRFHDLATAAGFDDGLLVDETGRISEGNITNVGFWRDGSVVWPDAPKLDGITMLVLQRELKAGEIPQQEAVVRVKDLAAYDGMILCNSHGWGLVGRVDDTNLRHDDAFTDAISAAYERCPLDPI